MSLGEELEEGYRVQRLKNRTKERIELAERIYIASISYTTHGVFLPSIEACYAAADKLLAARTKA